MTVGGSAIRLFGLTVRNQSLAEAAIELVQLAEQGVRTRTFFVNAHCVNVAANDAGYFACLSEADRLYADGIGMRLAARAADYRLVDNVNGTDLFPAVCRIAAERGVPIGLLGAKPGVADRCAARMRAMHPGLRIAFVRHGYTPAGEQDRLVADINAAGLGMLFVAMGVPGQEYWIQKHHARLQVPVRLGVGALFDFYSGDRTRAPPLVRRIGMEWAWRLVLEPQRLFARYVVGNPVFLARTIRRRVAGVDVLRARSPGGMVASERTP